MATELREASGAVRRQEGALEAPVRALVERLKRTPPVVAVTCARGSSAHAATFGKHLIEKYLGVPVAAAAPVVASVYGRSLRLDGQFFLAVSQSGRSDDLIETARSAREAGAITAALVNDPGSPLARACEFVLPMSAGPERSVAATKTFIASLAALLRLTAAWSGDAALASALPRLPERLDDACHLEWDACADALAASGSVIAIGRGPTLAIAREAALKLKETCNLHAEAFSGAEFLHGPVALASRGYPALLFPPSDETRPGLLRLADDLRAKGMALFAAERGAPETGRLPALTPDHPDADALCLIQSFYAFAERLALRLGRDVDNPRHLRKVTRTT